MLLVQLPPSQLALRGDLRAAGSYPDADLTRRADRIREWSLAGQDVFAYFNNDGNANAVRNAQTLQALLVTDGSS